MNKHVTYARVYNLVNHANNVFFLAVPQVCSKLSHNNVILLSNLLYSAQFFKYVTVSEPLRDSLRFEFDYVKLRQF